MKKILISQKHWITIAKRWREIPPPMHPWPSEMKIYQEFSQRALAAIENPRILVLGATPEMRDLAHSFKNAEVTCVDISLDMILAMCELMKHKKETEKEIWVRGDWATVPLAQDYYHLILGDAVTSNMLFKRWPQFLNHLKILLRSGGYFIHRVVVSGISGWYGKSLDEVFCQAQKEKWNFMELYFCLFMRVMRPNQDLSSAEAYRTIRKFYQSSKNRYQHPDPYIEKLLNQMIKYLPASSYKFSNRPQAICEKYFKKYFLILNKKFGGGERKLLVAYHPIYLLKKK